MRELMIFFTLQRHLCYVMLNSYALKLALTPTNKAFCLGSKLFALLCPSLLLASQTTDETGRRLHLVSAALSILQQRLMGREGSKTGQ